MLDIEEKRLLEAKNKLKNKIRNKRYSNHIKQVYGLILQNDS